jgi:hypothetical protein
VEYVDWNTHQVNQERLPNPIKYTYLKDRRFFNEKELRISLSALGMGQYVLNDGTALNFPPSLHMDFGFRRAITEGTIQEILHAQCCDSSFLRGELAKLGIVNTSRLSK